MSCMWIKEGFHFKFNGAQVSGLPTELSTFSILERSGLPTELPTELPTFSIYVSSGQSNLHGKIPTGSPWAAHSTAHWAAHFFISESSGLPTELSTVSLYGSSGAALFAWQNSHGQPTPLPTELPTFSYFASIGVPTELPTELPTVSIYESSGQPNLHGKIPMGSPRVTHSVTHVQPMGSKVGSSPVCSVWVP